MSVSTSRHLKRHSKRYSDANSKSFSINISPVSFTKRLVTQKIPQIKNKIGFFSGINVNSAFSTYSNTQHLEQLPNMYLDNDSIYESQYQELVNTILDKGNRSFQFEKFKELPENKIESEPIPLKSFKLCGRFNKKTEIRAKSLLPQTLAMLKIKKPLRKEKFIIDGIQALAYQKISGIGPGK